MRELRDKVAVITGASSGIGRSVALEFARHGAHLALAARRAAELEEVARSCRALGVRAIAVPCDISSPDSAGRLISTARAELGEIDILVNNAGFAVFDQIAGASAADAAAMMNTNYLGTLYCTQAALPRMLERRQGSIVNIASIAGIMGFFRMGGYCASKFAIIGLSEALRDEVIGSGVCVSLVCPGTVETDFFKVAERGKMPAASRLILGIPPERVARAVRRAVRRGSYRVIVPWTAAVFMKFKEIFPRSAHFLMRNISRAMDRGSI